MAEEQFFDQEVDPQMQLKRGLAVVRRRWFLFTSLLIAGLILGIGMFLFMPQEFETEAKIMLRGRWMLDGAAEVAAVSNSPSRVRAQLLEDELRSTTWIKTVLDRLEWPEWARTRGDNIAERAFVDRIKDRISVTVSRGETGERLVFLGFSYGDRWKVRDFLKGLRDQWVSEVFDSHKRDLDSEIAIKQGLLAEKEKKLDDVRRDLETFEARNGISQLAPYAIYQTRADDLQVTADRLYGEIANLQAKEDEFDVLLNERVNGELVIPPTRSSFVPVANQEYQERLRYIEQLSKELALLRARDYTEKHVQVKSAMARLTEALTQLGDGSIPEVLALDEMVEENPDFALVQTDLRTIRVALQGVRAQADRTDRDLTQVKVTLETLPGVLRQLYERQLRVDQQVDVVSLGLLELQPLLDTKAALTRLGPQALPYTTLEEPTAPNKPSSSMGLLALIACVLGMVGIGVVIVVGKEVLSTSFTSPDQARRTMKVEVLGEVAQIQTELEARRVRFNRLLQLAASLMLLAGMAATVWVCSRHPELLPAWLVDRASEFREGLI